MSLLNKIVSGKKELPITMILYGVPGIGKTTFAAGSDSPIFVTAEDIEEKDVPRFPKCKSYDEFISYLQTIRDEEHNFKTIVIDTIDSIEQLLWRKIMDESKSKSMAVALGGYGKAYEKAQHMFQEMVDDYLVPIRNNKGMNIIILAHTQKVKFEDPINFATFDQFDLQLHKRARPIFTNWVSCVLFANYRVFRVDGKDGNQYAVGEGERLVYTQPKPAYEVVKNRFDLEDELPLSWTSFKEGVQAYYKKTDPMKTEKERLIDKANAMNLEDGTKKIVLDTIEKARTINDITAIEKRMNQIGG